jgi:hypothetical protein
MAGTLPNPDLFPKITRPERQKIGMIWALMATAVVDIIKQGGCSFSPEKEIKL